MAIISLAEAKAHLNISVATHDTEIQAHVDTAAAAIIARVGVVESAAAQSYRAEGRALGLCLPTAQAVVSVQSVTPIGGAAIDMSLLHVDERTGVITYDLGGAFTSSAYDIVYTAGHTTVPDDLKMAVKELVRHTWTTQRGSGSGRPGSPFAESLANTVPGSAYTFPIRVEQLLRPYLHTGVR